LGKLVDVYFDAQTGQIEGYEVSGGLMTNLLSGHSFLPVSLVVEVNQDVALVKSEAADIIKAQTDGILDTVQPGRAKLEVAEEKTNDKAGEKRRVP
jgi:uncharacterized protein YrrD